MFGLVLVGIIFSALALRMLKKLSQVDAQDFKDNWPVYSGMIAANAMIILVLFAGIVFSVI